MADVTGETTDDAARAASGEVIQSLPNGTKLYTSFVSLPAGQTLDEGDVAIARAVGP